MEMFFNPKVKMQIIRFTSPKVVLITLMLISISCSPTVQRKYSEGFLKSKLHIYISTIISSEDLKEELPQTKEDRIIRKQIMEEAKGRAATILASHISLTVRPKAVSKKSDFIFNKSIVRSLKTGKIKSLDCSENFLCRAQVVFEASPVFEALQRVNEFTEEAGERTKLSQH